MAEDKNWAKSYLIDPLTAPDPSDETGPGTHFRSTFAPPSETSLPQSAAAREDEARLRKEFTGDSAATTSTNPFRRRSASQSHAYPTPPTSASPRRDQFPHSHRQEAFSAYADDKPTPMSPGKENTRPRRSSSLKERYPGDPSIRPLDVLRKESKKAYRSPHLRKQHIPGADMIDRLDVSTYHHEGPYDAALMSRNTNIKSSPLAAIRGTNNEALKATPKENIQNSVERHHPLDGVAIVPPGVPDQFGRVYKYEEGTDMMRDLGGNYKRVPGVKYHPDDLKGKGEPSYTVEKALKEHKQYGESGYEMKSRPRNRSLGQNDQDEAAVMGDDYLEGETSGVRRSNTTGNKVTAGLKKRFGSLRRRKEPVAA